MSEVRSELKYLESHEWARADDDNVVTVGITDHAQDALGDVVFVELPEVGATVTVGTEAGVVESVKAASDIYAPCDLEIVEVNAQLDDSPDLVNTDCYGQGHLLRFKSEKPTNLMDANAYEALLANERTAADLGAR